MGYSGGGVEHPPLRASHPVSSVNHTDEAPRTQATLGPAESISEGSGSGLLLARCWAVGVAVKVQHLGGVLYPPCWS